MTNSKYEDDFWTLKKCGEENGIVFAAHPLIHHFPWDVNEKRSRANLAEVASHSTWHRAAQQQAPSSLWRHRNTLTEYQVWVAYRVATMQLNLYHPGRKNNNACKLLPSCDRAKETLEHIHWGCPCAQATWTKLLGMWAGEEISPVTIKQFQRYCASRKAPPLSRTIKT
ncbi:hypothetical protein PPTG_10092 [Phytophthora nicotianae INRA-310]|uniref:Uncharacterized protein n=1 Tax=Phytophthora nicotianae (strain INRA-310) TaxID=761204 RepID=W2QEZ7_PHYN3|nr:hypothetical protein PPTG_10092 [Phytophthora nicotianae INRA-310]ETN11099.1 hypothetical protein PPTG_10092 [Phytophthora nicotianae INRA-310]